ncbi:hypothetical protein [Glycomyces paridis]|uniref:hypothetical protein n=1 Tax=Glycomyces paridis TaxID=2126555 RepID=UPI001864011C|nr:hypothetical protein [Glycomyces paridis]
MDSLALLTDPAFAPPPAPDGPPGSLAWLRHGVARFASGPAHRRRRDLALEALAPLDSKDLRVRAREGAAAVLAAAVGPVDVMDWIARDVPVGVLAAALGAPGADPGLVRTVAAAYPVGDSSPAADAAVVALVDAFGGVADEASAARIGLLVQTCEATAALIGNTLRAKTAARVAAVLGTDPPVLATFRQGPDGVRVRVDLAALPFGAGAHACPGRDQALALATGVCEALRHKHVLRIEEEPHPTLRMPSVLEVAP